MHDRQLVEPELLGDLFLPKGQIVAQGVIGSRLIYRWRWSEAPASTTTSAGALTVTSLKRTKSVRELLVFRLVVERSVTAPGC